MNRISLLARWLILASVLFLTCQCKQSETTVESSPEVSLTDTVPPPTRSPAPLSEEALAFQQLLAKKSSLAFVDKQLGFAFVPFTATGVRLNFYAGPDPAALITDSLVYKRDDYRLKLVHSPADFQPFYFKEDFQLLLLRMTDIAGRRAEVEVNAESGRTAWVDGASVRVQDWATFLESVAFVRPISWSVNPPRKTAAANAEIIPNIPVNRLLQPLRVKGDWIQVKTFSENNAPLPSSGWIRWRDGEKVLVSWDYVL